MKNGELGNTCVLIQEYIIFKEIEFLSNVRLTAVKLFYEKWCTIAAVYPQPSESIEEQTLLDILHRLPEPSIVVGDFNPRYTLWYDSESNTCGPLLERLLCDESVSVLNNAGTTHIDPRTKTENCLHVFLCSNSAVLDF